jgi:hypothetical protein
MTKTERRPLVQNPSAEGMRTGADGVRVPSAEGTSGRMLLGRTIRY